MQSPDLADQNLPGIPEEKNHDQNSEAPTELKTSTVEKLKQISKSVFESGGVIFKRGGGRPRKDNKPNKLDIPLNATPTDLPIGVAADTSKTPSNLDPSLVKRCCSAMLKAAQSVVESILSKRARLAGYTPPEIKTLLLDNSITEKELDSFSELAVVCLQKYGVGTQYAPEIGLAVIAAGIGVRYTTTFATLNAEIQSQRDLPIKPDENSKH
jgi:hypothetical protein